MRPAPSSPGGDQAVRVPATRQPARPRIGVRRGLIRFVGPAIHASHYIGFPHQGNPAGE
jgi:hypothetical protein